MASQNKSLSDALKSMLNKFADSQPALRLKDQPLEKSNPKLGDLMDKSLADREVTVDVVYDFAVDGGSVGTKALLGLPAGAIVRKLMTDVTTALDSGGSATVAIEVGATVLKAATAFDDAAYTGVDEQSFTPFKLGADANLEFVIADAALTAGRMRLILTYVRPESE